MIHEDERRILESWPEAKVITAKQDCVLGGHYHKIKTEMFILTSGWAILRFIFSEHVMEVGKIYRIEPKTLHSFEIGEGSVLIGLCSHPYDPTDDYPV